MKILKGNKITNIDSEILKNVIKNYKNTTIDIGTGDGKFPYKRASKNRDSFYIGLDAVADNMIPSAIKVGKKAGSLFPYSFTVYILYKIRICYGEPYHK